MGITAISPAFAMRAINHITTVTEGFVGPKDRIVDSIEEFVGALEFTDASVVVADG